MSPYKNKSSNVPHDTGTDQPVVSECGKRIFFVTGEQGCGKSTFLAALIQKFNLQPSGFITKKEEASSESALYMHPIVSGTAIYRYSTGNCVGICRSPKPVGFAPIFDAYGVMCLNQAEKTMHSSFDRECTKTPQPSLLPVIVMDELGVMEAEAELFFHTVCTLFSNPRYYILGAVKPHRTRFLPVLEQIPEAVVFHLTPQNRPALYKQLEQAQNFAAFLYAVHTEIPNGKTNTE
ncbi:hypothetical protein DWB79_00885 [Treponema medium]|uniref:AAA+ ATPase domain-containing protein n=1 Tax=Treponema medium TaxID=58231 RepID=A0ABX7LUW0_TREMD|nr:hypothetical protein DWB79_00885 [Treponema medium]